MDALIGRIPHAENRRLVKRYVHQRAAEGIKPSTLGNDANCLKAFCEFLGPKSLEDVTKDDIIDYVIDGSRDREWRNKDADGNVTVTTRKVRLKPSTLKQRKICLRAFYKWLEGTEAPPQFEGLRNHTPAKGQPTSEKVIPKEDLRKLLQAHPFPRDKAILAMLYESGFRAGELCALNVGSVKFEERGVRAKLPSNAEGLKSGPREVFLIDCATYVHAWFEAHPHKDEPLAPLFYGMSHRAPGKRLTGNAVYQFVKKAGERAGLKHSLNPHMFRHSAATERAKLGWSEMQMRHFFGWSKRSDMPATYIHLAGRDYEDMELARRGLLGEKEIPSPALSPLICRVCKEANLPTAKFCSHCRNPVSPDAIAEMDKQRQEELDQSVARVLKRGDWTRKKVELDVYGREHTGDDESLDFDSPTSESLSANGRFRRELTPEEIEERMRTP